LRLAHLEARMFQSGHKQWEGKLTPTFFRELIKGRIEALDVTSAKNDIARFLSHPEHVSIWSRDFFMAVAEKIRFV